MFRNTYLQSNFDNNTKEYVINTGNAFLLTPGGIVVSNKNEDFINDMISELMQFPVLKIENNALIGEQLGYVSLYNLYSTLHDFVENSSSKLDDISTDLLNDPVLYINPGPEAVEQIQSWKSVSRYISEVTSKDGELILFSGFSTNDNEFFALLNNKDSFIECSSNIPKFVDFSNVINKAWNELSNSKKSVVITLTHLCDSLLSSMCFASGNCSSSEFSNAILAAGSGHFMYGEVEGDDISAEGRHSIVYKQNVEIANICLKFLTYVDSGDELSRAVANIIDQGESLTAEFKETLSLDVKKQTKEKYLEKSVLKTISGFLNAKGGALLVGVKDDGEQSGIEKEVDKFYKGVNDDFLKHFKNILKSSIGEEYYPFIDYQIVGVDNKSILYIKCEQSKDPCYLNGKNFYVRTNPATDKLEGPKLVNYIKNHFGV